MTEPTPKHYTTDPREAVHLWRQKAEKLELALARKEALLWRWMSGLPDGEDPRKLLEDTEHELEGKK